MPLFPLDGAVPLPVQVSPIPLKGRRVWWWWPYLRSQANGWGLGTGDWGGETRWGTGQGHGGLNGTLVASLTNIGVPGEGGGAAQAGKVRRWRGTGRGLGRDPDTKARGGTGEGEAMDGGTRRGTLNGRGGGRRQGRDQWGAYGQDVRDARGSVRPIGATRGGGAPPARRMAEKGRGTM